MRPYLALAAGLTLAAGLHAGSADGRLDIYWNDVEGGGGTLIVTPAGESILIDSGNPGGRDAGRIHDTATEAAGLKRIDYFILTHFHIDHFGGIAELSRLMPVGQVYDNGVPVHDPDLHPSDDVWRRTTAPYRVFQAARRNRTFPGLVLPLRQAADSARLQLRCVACRQDRIPAPPDAGPNPLAAEDSTKALKASENDNSGAWVLDFGPFRFWDGGDLTWNMEGRLVDPVNRVGQVDVYQVDHHGLPVSNNPVLIHSLAPTVSVMNNGILKGTSASAMQALRSSPGLKAMYQLHKNLRPEDPQDNTADGYIANFDRDPNHRIAHYIKLSVAPDGTLYTITIEGDGPGRTYPTRLNK